MNNCHSVNSRPRRRNAKRSIPTFHGLQIENKTSTAPNRAPYPSFISACPLGAPVYGGGEVSPGRPDRWASLLTRRKVTFQKKSRDKKDKAG